MSVRVHRRENMLPAIVALLVVVGLCRRRRDPGAADRRRLCVASPTQSRTRRHNIRANQSPLRRPIDAIPSFIKEITHRPLEARRRRPRSSRADRRLRAPIRTAVAPGFPFARCPSASRAHTGQVRRATRAHRCAPTKLHGVSPLEPPGGAHRCAPGPPATPVPPGQAGRLPPSCLAVPPDAPAGATSSAAGSVRRLKLIVLRARGGSSGAMLR